MTSEKKRYYGSVWTALALFVLVGVVLLIVSHDFLAMRVDPPIYPGAGVTRVVRLSSYSQAVANAPIGIKIS